MKTAYYREFSQNLHLDMEYKIYGHAGKPVLVFPSQDGRFFDYENNGMIAAAEPFIEAGRIQMFCCDSNDINSWSSTSWNNRRRIECQEEYFHYICDELCPRIFELNAADNGVKAYGILATGCSMGASHALNFLLRRPDLFSGCIALSGAYNARFFFPNYFDDLVFANSPVDYIDGMPNDHPLVNDYRDRDIILCCGRGAWEHPMQEDAKRMSELFGYKNIPAWVDFWGDDVAHDWPWWRKQLPYYLNFIC
ncbi:MAG: esterase [Erysipelotrichia bacterium]|nr:esterase [Erysipelotrichia bacterium]